jgi:hypothetical protein
MLTANFGTPAWRIQVAPKYSRVDLNLVMVELTVLALTHKYTDQDVFDLIHSKEYLIVPDLSDML